jgi:very-short-patch-repair endonuclease/predicted transcriptional regulator of viral defense system
VRQLIEANIAKLASTQYAVIGRAQAVALGMSHSTIKTKLENGLWRPVERGVYVMSGAPACWERSVVVAVVASGTGAVASHRAAGRLHALLHEVPTVVDITVLRGRHPRPGHGREVHRTRVLRSSDVTRVRGIPVTSVPRTLLDLVRVLSDEVMEAALDTALLLGRTSIGAMRRYLAACGRTRYVGRLVRVLDDREFGVPASELERVFERILKRERLPYPSRQHTHLRYRVDYAYPDQRIAVEVDGRATHSGKQDVQRDRRRQNDIVLDGFLVLRFTWDDVTKDPDYVVATIRRALDGAGGGS